MTDNKPIESRFQEYKEFASKHKIAATLIGVWIIAPTIWSVLVTVRSWNAVDLNTKIENQAHEISEKTSEIQRLETLLTPFRTIALQRFSGSDTAALGKLASQILALDKALLTAQSELASVKVSASYPKMRRVLNVRPTGVEVIDTGNRSGAYASARSASPITGYMCQFGDAINKNDTTNAVIAIEKAIETIPDWPYGYFFRGALTSNTNDFRRAVELFALARAVEIDEPESLLFEALSQLYLGDYEAATQLLDKLKLTGVKPTDIGMILCPPNCPKTLANRVIALKSELRGRR